ncbi:MAG: MFS transporter [Afipia sp.]|nr:MFS transporter [Afipia sp.]
MGNSTVHVGEFVDSQPLHRGQLIIVVLCAVLMLIDGFDTQAISYAAPLISTEWSLPREQLGPIFSSALVGLMIGYLVFSPLSDRFGHRQMMLTSTIGFSVLTLATTFATNATELMIIRLVTGIGLGSAIPSAVALTSEFAPKRYRASFVLAIYCGFSLGFVVAGAIAAWFLPIYGWRSLFWLGAIAPLILCVLLYFILPESLDFMVRRKSDPSMVASVINRIFPQTSVKIDANSRFAVDEREGSSSVANLFRGGRMFGTVILWAVFFLNLAMFYALQSWMPTMLTSLKYSLNSVALATSLSTTGGIVVALVIGPAMDRLGPYRSLATLYMLGVFFVSLMGAALGRPEWILLAASFFAGVCISGGQKSVIALAAIFYPGAVRSTGVGWALGIGRIGGIGGPLLLGLLLSAHFEPAQVFYALAIPMLICGCLIAVLGWQVSRGQTRSAKS